MEPLPRSWLIMVSLCTILARLARNLPWILARVPWLRKLGNFLGRNFLKPYRKFEKCELEPMNQTDYICCSEADDVDEEEEEEVLYTKWLTSTAEGGFTFIEGRQIERSIPVGVVIMHEAEPGGLLK